MAHEIKFTSRRELNSHAQGLRERGYIIKGIRHNSDGSLSLVYLDPTNPLPPAGGGLTQRRLDR